jgi:poly(3-hydroxybutyrate) depolymerase
MEAGSSGPGRHTVRDPRDGRREIAVHTYRPSGFSPEGPVLLVIHGRNRNGADYRDWFGAEAERHGVFVVAPEFDEAQYAHPHDYNFAAMVDAQGKPRPRSEWLFPVVDFIFEEATRRFGLQRDRYFLFGHSAGGQLVHRLATFGWSPRIERAVAANSGSYTMPLASEPFPHGIGGTGLGDDDLRALFSRPLTILLGDADVDPAHYQLPRDPPDMKQGAHRFERGQRYFAAAQREAVRLGVPLAWSIAIAPGVEHSARHIAPFAARELFPA